MNLSTEDRVRMLENRCRKQEIALETAHTFQTALLRILKRRFPGIAAEMLAEVEKLGNEAKAERLMDEALAADALVNQLKQEFSLPAND